MQNKQTEEITYNLKHFSYR